MFIPENLKGTDYVIGDLHGMYERLMYEMDIVDFDIEKDRLFSVGDLIDRGPSSVQCLELLKEPWFYACLGNHEKLFIDAKTDYTMRKIHHQNGGEWVLNTTEEKLAELRTLVRTKMPYSITVQVNGMRVGICHAEPPTNDWRDTEVPLGEIRKNRMLWARERIALNSKAKLLTNPEAYRIRGVDITVHGHTPRKDIVQIANSFFIDTAVCHGGFFELIKLEDLVAEGA